MSLHYLYRSAFAFNTQPVAFSLLTSHLHANLDVCPWLCFLEICAHLNLLHRQGRGHRVTQGWQVKATAEDPLCPSCCVSGTAQQGLPSTNCTPCNQGHSLPGVPGKSLLQVCPVVNKGVSEFNLISQELNPFPSSKCPSFPQGSPKGAKPARSAPLM